jgi:hypothetical protein
MLASQARSTPARTLVLEVALPLAPHAGGPTAAPGLPAGAPLAWGLARGGVGPTSIVTRERRG